MSQVETKDALLHAINEEYVEAVEVLLDHEESIHVEGEPWSWETLSEQEVTESCQCSAVDCLLGINHRSVCRLSGLEMKYCLKYKSQYFYFHSLTTTYCRPASLPT